MQYFVDKDEPILTAVIAGNKKRKSDVEKWDKAQVSNVLRINWSRTVVSINTMRVDVVCSAWRFRNNTTLLFVV
jgi:hypothetical protein